jgi:hypothetical protein
MYEKHSSKIQQKYEHGKAQNGNAPSDVRLRNRGAFPTFMGKQAEGGLAGGDGGGMRILPDIFWWLPATTHKIFGYHCESQVLFPQSNYALVYSPTFSIDILVPFM